MLNFPGGWHQATAALGHFEVLENVVLAAGEVGLHDFEQCSREQSTRCGSDQGEIFWQARFVKSVPGRSCGLRCVAGSIIMRASSDHETHFLSYLFARCHVGNGSRTARTECGGGRFF
jgi:hypothetical protein